MYLIYCLIYPIFCIYAHDTKDNNLIFVLGFVEARRVAKSAWGGPKPLHV